MKEYPRRLWIWIDFVLWLSPFANHWSHIISLVLNWLVRSSSILVPQLKPWNLVVARSDAQGGRNTPYAAQWTMTVVYHSQMTQGSWLQSSGTCITKFLESCWAQDVRSKNVSSIATSLWSTLLHYRRVTFCAVIVVVLVVGSGGPGTSIL